MVNGKSVLKLGTYIQQHMREPFNTKSMKGTNGCLLNSLVDEPKEKKKKILDRKNTTEVKKNLV